MTDRTMNDWVAGLITEARSRAQDVPGEDDMRKTVSINSMVVHNTAQLLLDMARALEVHQSELARAWDEGAEACAAAPLLQEFGPNPYRKATGDE